MIDAASRSATDAIHSDIDHRHELCRLEDTERLFNEVKKLCDRSAKAVKIA
jgi:hypothetical protein